jgi:hypothetical protein
VISGVRSSEAIEVVRIPMHQGIRGIVGKLSWFSVKLKHKIHPACSRKWCGGMAGLQWVMNVERGLVVTGW